jgi:hypothetical protein
MNRLRISALIIFFFTSIIASAQYSKLKGSQSLHIGFGFHDAGLLANVYSLKTFDQKVKAGFGGGFAFGDVSDIRYKAMFVDALGSYTLHNTRVMSVNAVAGISFIGDFKNEFASEKYSKNFSFNYGVFGGGETEFMATRKLSFVLGGTYRYYLRKDFGNRRYHLTAGIRLTM